jgi:hypothetical protein
MRNGMIHPLQGQPLPSDWRAQASARAKAAEQAYMERLQAAWQAPKAPKAERPAVQSCRLSQ